MLVVDIALWKLTPCSWLALLKIACKHKIVLFMMQAHFYLEGNIHYFALNLLEQSLWFRTMQLGNYYFLFPISSWRIWNLQGNSDNIILSLVFERLIPWGCCTCNNCSFVSTNILPNWSFKFVLLERYEIKYSKIQWTFFRSKKRENPILIIDWTLLCVCFVGRVCCCQKCIKSVFIGPRVFIYP